MWETIVWAIASVLITSMVCSTIKVVLRETRDMFWGWYKNKQKERSDETKNGQ